MTLASGTQLGPYRIERLLGVGGMGEVYKAHDTRLERAVALKVLPSEVAGDPAKRQRFQREARAISALTHPHICTLYDVGHQDGVDFLVMEYLEGQTLAKRLREGAMPAAEALRHGQEIADALDRAHRAGIVHRDLKPSNIMLTPGGAKLLDFGLAKLRESDPVLLAQADTAAATPGATLTERGMILGTLDYMAPEQLEGKPADTRTDIFAFGALLYEMLSGRRPFAGDSPADRIGATLHVEPPPLPPSRIAEPAQRDALERIVRRCLAKDPENRWQSARDLGLELAWASQERAPVDRSAAAAAPARRRVLAWLAAGALLCGAAAAAWWLAGQAAGRGKSAALPSGPPVIVLMDSPLPDRVYDPRTRAAGGTNADDLTDVLRALPVELHKETTSSLWHREDQVLSQDPSMIVTHLSAFVDSLKLPEGPTLDELRHVGWERLRLFLAYVGGQRPYTRFLIYTRGFADEAERRAWVSAVEQRFPHLAGRVAMVHVPGDDAATFRDPATAAMIKREVEALLAP
jgi:predicted Ser/Thr protein kinase